MLFNWVPVTHRAPKRMLIRKGNDVLDFPGGMVVLSGVQQSDHASAEVGIVPSSRLASDGKNYGKTSLDSFEVGRH